MHSHRTGIVLVPVMPLRFGPATQLPLHAPNLRLLECHEYSIDHLKFMNEVSYCIDIISLGNPYSTGTCEEHGSVESND